MLVIIFVSKLRQINEEEPSVKLGLTHPSESLHMHQKVQLKMKQRESDVRNHFLG